MPKKCPQEWRDIQLSDAQECVWFFLFVFQWEKGEAEPGRVQEMRQSSRGQWWWLYWAPPQPLPGSAQSWVAILLIELGLPPQTAIVVCQGYHSHNTSHCTQHQTNLFQEVYPTHRECKELFVEAGTLIATSKFDLLKWNSQSFHNEFYLSGSRTSAELKEPRDYSNQTTWVITSIKLWQCQHFLQNVKFSEDWIQILWRSQSTQSTSWEYSSWGE